MMLLRRLYYHLKPSLPWKLRMTFRRILAGSIRRQTEGVWPILETAGRAPADWAGWPEGRSFAVVLTHDVEGPDGLEKVRRLAELEMSLGFRSCFNFIPEGPYTVPSALRGWLVSQGFEVGVHDFNHDGKLFSSRATFRQRARQINHYLREWKAVGFRAGFMHHNLDWHHELDILYDSSTFDTDPFEPQPDGVGTIFPFWVPAPGVAKSAPADSALPKAGYIELPYTLPQDSTLFLLLRMAGNDVWGKKLDWIARCGGMVLLDVHPDYIAFENHEAADSRYPLDHYRRFLEKIRGEYAGRFWQALPREVALHARQTMMQTRSVEVAVAAAGPQS
jgi:hypothetical protein